MNELHEARRQLAAALRFRDATLSALVTLAILGMGFESLTFGCVGAAVVWLWFMILR